MRNSLVLLCFALAGLVLAEAAVFQREQNKQLNLAPEEIDPDVAPPPPNKIESYDENDIYVNNDNEILDEADNEIADEPINEISQSAVTGAPAAATTTVAAVPTETATPEEGPTGLAKYCKCKGNHCDCCREFNLPFIPVKGPGCARMSYLGNKKMSVSLKYGDLTLASRTVSGKRSRPICVGLPGGYSQFCGRIYGLSKATEDFKACLGFELRADDEVEAALRVSCFNFGAGGLRVAEAEPLPVEVSKEDEDDDDDIFGFGGGAEDEDDEDEYDEDDEEEESDDDADADYVDDEAEDEAPSDADYAGFSLAGFLDELDDDDDEDSKPSATPSITSLASAAVSAAGTRNAAADSVQSKDVKGTDDATAPPSLETTDTAVPAASTVAAVSTVVADQVTPVPQQLTPTTSRAKTKRSKKAKTNKKKKAADTDGDFAYEIISGLLDFFN